MKTMVMTITTSSLMLFLTLYTISSLPQTQSRVLLPTNATDIIEKSCKQTPYYDVCTSNLRSRPGSSNADVKGLTGIMVGVLRTTANETSNYISDLIMSNPINSKDKQICGFVYDFYILSKDVLLSSVYLDSGDFQAVYGLTSEAVTMADACDESYKGSPRLTQLNKVVHDVAAVAAAIAKLLL